MCPVVFMAYSRTMQSLPWWDILFYVMESNQEGWPLFRDLFLLMHESPIAESGQMWRARKDSAKEVKKSSQNWKKFQERWKGKWWGQEKDRGWGWWNWPLFEGKWSLGPLKEAQWGCTHLEKILCAWIIIPQMSSQTEFSGTIFPLWMN